MNEHGINEFETEEITRTIAGLANAIATGSATALVFDDERDNAAHSVSRRVIACVVVVASL